ncbi:hypothetical protein E2C01_012732 [Portunus trituberculatus]|uniref:Uncharacterized protein n=1 Tax=Portunus trituberculatus TaxID=210409 RepID=A0A5B7DFH7_PORTR|nr:hypothetical protein [Portunus trituberculatus]
MEEGRGGHCVMPVTSAIPSDLWRCSQEWVKGRPLRFLSVAQGVTGTGGGSPSGGFAQLEVTWAGKGSLESFVACFH